MPNPDSYHNLHLDVCFTAIRVSSYSIVIFEGVVGAQKNNSNKETSTKKQTKQKTLLEWMGLCFSKFRNKATIQIVTSFLHLLIRKKTTSNNLKTQTNLVEFSF